jgi:hypothetical protein
MPAQRLAPAAAGDPGLASRFTLPSPIARLRRIALVAGVVVLTPALGSYLITMSRPSNSALAIRSIEWLRDHGAAGIVAGVESVYYSLTAPSKGGPALRSLPHVGFAGGLGPGSAAEEHRPQRVASIIQPALPGEGTWHSARAQPEARPPILVTTLRDQPEYPRAVVGLAWLDSAHTTLTLNPGRLEPSVSLPRGSMDVPSAQRPSLLATFNSGFKLSDDHSGFILNGRTYAPMQDGQATLVGYTNGSIDVIDWRYGPSAPANVAFARQNLPLIVDEGAPATNVANSGEWGATVGNATLVWRSGIGVDRRGNLIYAAGEDQTVASLARALVAAGAVRAMELDINSYWVSFITYGLRDAGQPQNLLPAMERSASRYLEPDDRDFFAVYSR